MRQVAADGDGPLAIVCGGGSLPFAVAEAVERRGRKVVLFAVRGWADAERVAAFRHHWARLGKFGWFLRVARQEGCRDVAFIGVVMRPTISQIRYDLATLRQLPRFLRAVRGGDDHLLSALARMCEDHGLRVVGAHDIAPEILAPAGVIGGRTPSERDFIDIRRGLALIEVIGPFDVGQAVVVSNNHVLAVEGIEGTDHLLARVAEMRRLGRIQTAPGVGVLVKAPKPGQDRRFDLPTIGPKTIHGVAQAQLGGIAVVAGETIVAEPQELAQAADRERLFVIGVANRKVTEAPA
jgi:DUF1009 family protein